jgi:peptidoglycan/LPS O-acetylase OafA/YrhL
VFGTYRFVLALLVVVTHIGHVEIIGGFAVWGFFMLSGFLITGVLHSRYGFHGAGLRAFTLSRALRLFPTYWVVALSTLAATYLFHGVVDPLSINRAFGPMTETREWFSAAFIIGHTTLGLGRVEHALSPPLWAVDVELQLYVLSCLVVSRSRLLAKSAVLFSVAAFPVLWFIAKNLIRAGDIDLGGQLIYSFLLAALLPYSIGAYLSFAAKDWHLARPSWRGFLAASILIALLAFGVSRNSVVAAYVLVIPVFAYLIAALSKLKSDRFRTVDDFLGQMSYPIYLIHYLCAYLIVVMASHVGGISWLAVELSGETLRYTPTGFAVICLFVIFCAFGFAYFFERPIERMRHTLVRRLSGVHWQPSGVAE